MTTRRNIEQAPGAAGPGSRRGRCAGRVSRGLAGFVLLALAGGVCAAPPAASATASAAASATPSAADPTTQAWMQLPRTAELVYRTSASFHLGGLPLHLAARTTTQWHRDGPRYEAHLHIETADFDQDSQGGLAPDGHLAPTNYNEKRPFHHADAVAIDWALGQVRYAGGAPAAAPPAGTQDRLSLQFELALQRLRHPEQYPAGSRHEIRLVGPHDVDPWTFTVAAPQPLETGRGVLQAVCYAARRPVGAVEETIDVCLAADLGWLPVRIRMVDRNQAVIDSVLESARID